MSATTALRDLGLGLWVGGLAAIDFVEAPARFRTEGLDRNQIAAVGRSVFRSYGKYEIGVAAATAGLAALAARDENGAGDRAKPVAALAGVMLALTAVQQGYLHPKMHALQAGLDFVNRDATNPGYAAHRKVHGAYMAADSVKFLLGVAASLVK